MESVLRGIGVYVFLMIVFRLSGKRTLAQVGTFDLVLIIIIAETTQQALIGEDFSITGCWILILTLVGIDILLSFLQHRSPFWDRLLDGLPIVLVEDGKPIEERMHKSRVREHEVLAAARELQGLERMDQIKYAVLERNGGISIIPKEQK